MKRKKNKNEAPVESAPAAEETAVGQSTAEESAVESADVSADMSADVSEDVSAEEVREEPAKEKRTSAAAEAARITLPLSIICIAAALMLAVVHALTADTIDANAAREKQEAILTIFPEGDAAVLQASPAGTEIYTVQESGELIGYCVGLSENGFGGAISMMVGVDPAGAVSGVRILSLSETPGVGTKVKSDSFLSRFRGREEFVLGGNLDGISGATVSSRAVVRGVNRAMSAVAETFHLVAPEEDGLLELPAVPVPAETAETGDAEVSPPPAQPAPAETAADVQTQPAVHLASALPWASIPSAGKSSSRVMLVGEETIYVSETTAPPETEPIPAETQPPETEPVPIETQPPETEPVPIETQPPETEPIPIETQPPETEPVPAETQPPETEPIPAETVPAAVI